MNRVSADPFLTFHSDINAHVKLTVLFTNPAAGKPPDATASPGRSPIDGIWPFFGMVPVETVKRPVAKEPPDW